MKALFHVGLVFVSLACASAARAQLGETPAQCEARYGKPVRGGYKDGRVPGQKKAKYDKDELTIGVEFWQEKAGLVIFIKDGKFSNDEIQKLLEASKGASSWSEPKTNPQNPNHTTDWSRADGIEAMLSSEGDSLTIVDPSYLAAVNAAEDRKK